MKKATLRSIATWAGGACLLIGYQIAGQHWPALTNRSIKITATLLAVAIASASLGLMEDVEPRELLLSRKNTDTRNALNAMNFAFGIGGALGLAYLAGLFGSVEVSSPTFYAATCMLLLATLFQAGFTIATRRRVQTGNPA